jgi:hypothetical protein
MSKKTKEPPKRVKHKGNINFQNPLMGSISMGSISNKERGRSSSKQSDFLGD